MNVVWRVAGRFGVAPDEREDVVQDVFVVVYHGRTIGGAAHIPFAGKPLAVDVTAHALGSPKPVRHGHVMPVAVSDRGNGPGSR